ncbi:MAG TPA: hypothetical protein VKA84_23595 [Gemmatimonadaceae bacterium]|nr:hypothetical protein [Gemmatimonadaceae bacterium]
MPPFLADATFWVAVVCSLVAQVAIVRAAFVAGSAGASRASRAREVTWAVVPGLALAFVLYFTWRAVHPLPPQQSATHPAAPAAAAAGARA